MINMISRKKSFSSVPRESSQVLLKDATLKSDIEVEITFVQGCLCTAGAIWPLLLKVLRLRDLLDLLNWLSPTKENSLHHVTEDFRSSGPKRPNCGKGFLVKKLLSRFLAERKKLLTALVWVAQPTFISSKGIVNSSCTWKHYVRYFT